MKEHGHSTALMIVQTFDGEVHSSFSLTGSLQQVRFLSHGPLVAILDDTNQITILNYETSSVVSTKRFSESISLLYTTRFHENLYTYSPQSGEISFLEVTTLQTTTVIYINEAVTNYTFTNNQQPFIVRHVHDIVQVTNDTLALSTAAQVLIYSIETHTITNISYQECLFNQSSFFSINNVVYLAAQHATGEGEIHFYNVLSLPIQASLVKAASLTEETASEPDMGHGHDDIIGDFAKQYEEVKREEHVIEEVPESESEDEEVESN